MQEGKVKWFSNQKGFGFIESADGDVFVHISAVEKANLRTLNDGQKISFDIAEEKGKNSAVNLKVE